MTEPVVLELAPLPRDKMGPFLLLGVEKDAATEPIEANWARRVIWARKNQLPVPLENINWARELLRDPERRVRADVTSLNTDVTDRVLQRLQQRYASADGLLSQMRGGNRAMEEYAPEATIPDVAEVRASISLPAMPREVPAVHEMLSALATLPADPWLVELP